MKKYNILSITVTFIILYASYSTCAEPLKTCAIVPFGSANNKYATEITDMRNNYEQLISNSGKYKVINNTITKLVKAEYFGKKYNSIVSAAMNAGIILNADYVIYGQITEAKGTHTLTTTLVDIHAAKAVRSVRSDITGNITEFARIVPANNINTLLKVKKTSLIAPYKKKIKPALTKKVTTPTATITKKKPEKRLKPKKSPKKKKSSKPSFNWAETFSWRWQTKEYPDFNNIKYQNEFMQYLENHLELGMRVTSFTLDETEGEFLGTINLLVKDDSGSAFKLFADWMFNPYIGIELTSDEIEVRTYTDTEDNHSDGTLTMSGPVIYMFGRYPFQIDTEKFNFIIAPYIGIGLAMFSSDFSEDAWWTLGYDSPAQWEASGRPSTPAGDYSRKIDVNNSTVLIIAGGCTFKIYNGLSLDLYMRVIDAETDATFTRTHTTNGDHDIIHGHFPMKTTGYGFGLRYAF